MALTEPIGSPRGLRKSGKSRIGRGGSGGLRLEGKRKKHWKVFIKRTPKPNIPQAFKKGHQNLIFHIV